MTKIKSKIESEEDIVLELIRDGKLKENKKYYVNNKELFEEYQEYYKKKLEWEQEGKGIPPLTRKIGEAIIQIATRRCNSWYKVKDYSREWKEEMIANAIMIATARSHNFDPTRFDNPFSYLTQICNNAIIEELKRHRKNLYIKYKSMEEVNNFQAEIDEETENEDVEIYMGGEEPSFAAEERRSYIYKFEESHFKQKESKDTETNNIFDED